MNWKNNYFEKYIFVSSDERRHFGLGDTIKVAKKLWKILHSKINIKNNHSRVNLHWILNPKIYMEYGFLGCKISKIFDVVPHVKFSNKMM